MLTRLRSSFRSRPPGLRTFVASAVAFILLQGFGLHSAISPGSRAAAASLAFRTIYDFTGKGDGGYPATLISDATGALYGITTADGSYGSGTAFKLTPSGNSLKESVIFEFKGCHPVSLIEDNGGNLYGVATGGSLACNDGQIFKLTRSGSKYTETILHQFTGLDGLYPTDRLVGDASGSLYGSAEGGGNGNGGTIFKLTLTPKGYAFRILHSFDLTQTGAYFPGLVSMDRADDIYVYVSVGTLYSGIYKLARQPSGAYAGGLIYNLGEGESTAPSGYPIVDAAGNILGTTLSTIYELKHSSSGYKKTTLHDSCFPTGLSSANGILYGVTNCLIASSLFAVAPSKTGYSYSQLYSFPVTSIYPGGFTVVGNPGIVYGTITRGSKYGFGSVYALTL